MDKEEWKSSFNKKTRILNQAHTWRLKFDNNILPNNINTGWSQYMRTTRARFKCTKCGRGWPSNRVMVIFHMRLMNGEGTVKVRPCYQRCKRCTSAPMEKPSVGSHNLDVLMEKLVEKIRIKCYHENLSSGNKQFISHEVKSPHEPTHCEGCMLGICTTE
ncbi:receptor-transporting protein 3-like [Odontesthes bonariensis]|uniref:receptor-transporting protein 3-like n=1 Tax=Odontesthes bonariensis TaxID=219752 RepID=UPI003F58B126